MRFELIHKDTWTPDLIYGINNRELECFIPDNYEWIQINYGQGEGQVKIENCEWGFYYSRVGISVILHEGEIKIENAIKFVNGVLNKVFQEQAKDVEILLIGTD